MILYNRQEVISMLEEQKLLCANNWGMSKTQQDYDILKAPLVYVPDGLTGMTDEENILRLIKKTIPRLSKVYLASQITVNEMITFINRLKYVEIHK